MRVMRTLLILSAVTLLGACSSGQVAHGYRDVSGQKRTLADLDRSATECDYEQDKMRALAGSVAAGPNLRESCMRSKGWELVERVAIR